MNPPLDSAWQWQSWIDSAKVQDCGFPLQNLPFCAFQPEAGASRVGVGIGDLVLDLCGCAAAGLLHTLPENIQRACAAPLLNPLMECGSEASTLVRQALMLLLRNDADASIVRKLTSLLRPMANTAFRKPVRIDNYTDFYASVHHATIVGRLFRPDGPLLPNYKYVPIGYHGRASSIVMSGTPIRRPMGQTKSPSAEAPAFGPCAQLDYEVEVGAYIGTGNPLGDPVAMAAADSHIFGFSLVNDWSARDIQAWEYQPLGPFLGKSFATTVSPWVVTPDALAPFRIPLEPRSPGDPEPLPYLRSPRPESAAIDLEVHVQLSTSTMREQSQPPLRLSSANLSSLYWSFAQMVAHHTSNGCNLLPGDLLASGTVSGPRPGSQGSLLEITQRGTIPLQLPNGELRSFLQDGDEITLTGICRREDFPSISFGECRGTVLPAKI